MQTLTDDFLSISVSGHGAELTSIRTKAGQEYLWQADPAFWKRHSPVLFPIVGSLTNRRYHYDNKEYIMGQHGFARDKEFDLISARQDCLVYRLVSDASTLAVYPFEFALVITYTLERNRIHVQWNVINTGKSKMFFQIGAHPAFLFPEFAPDSTDRGSLRLYKNAGSRIMEWESEMDTVASIDYILISEGGCADAGHIYHMNTPHGCLPLDTSTFDKDALIIENSQINKVVITSPSGRSAVGVTSDAPVFGIWSPPGKNAPFICIEPWYGRCDRAGFNGTLDQKDWINTLEPGQEFNGGYTIEIYQ